MAAAPAASSSSSLLCFLSLLLPFSIISSTTTSVQVSHFHETPPPLPYQNLNFLASSSLSRAHHLKDPRTNPPTTTASPLFSHSYGAYSISLSFGTPPQTLYFVFDTGSDFTWFPCTHRYLCKNCSFSSTRSPPLSFIPKLSSSSKILGCLNPKCSWIHRSNFQCKDCKPSSKNCTQICPPYLIFYGSGTTGGISLSETLNLPNRTVHDFLVGCSVFSSEQPAGIAGFGRGPPSFPSQLGLNKFSYCLLSHRFDDTTKSSSLVLDTDPDSGKDHGLSYTPFVKNPQVSQHPALSVYYYLALRQISVGGRRVKIPYKYLTPQPGGNGGTIVDSGTTFTYMSRDVFELVAAEFERQLQEIKYERAVGAEARTGLRPCINVPHRILDGVSLPELRFHFKGGAEMVLPLDNYFAFVRDDGGGASALCLTVVTQGVAGERQLSGGPSIILGNFQMQNFYVEYDLAKDRFGFRRQSCN
ncbi:hypothetical protein F2P56_032998 [Juglans regia]|uniref:Peptidase A1 domain-containing protein n=2 Tax=Juglans regia TaxID=51240 RepID=A0A833WVJ3_JUGRE|nr:probable aspartyl protease At4g16563 [Juglans regia]KAF5447444.1 hypothetical protein F2P56_032998 [Juglans regia]